MVVHFKEHRRQPEKVVMGTFYKKDDSTLLKPQISSPLVTSLYSLYTLVDCVLIM